MIKALQDQVVIEPKKDEKSAGGIILTTPQPKGVNSWEGTVVDVGPGKWESGKFVETTLKVGARVLYHTYPTGCDYETSDRKKKYVIVSERQVVAVLDDAKE